MTARAHAFVDDLDAPVLRAGDHHHLARVLRLAVGDPITVGDGGGRWRAARLGAGPDVGVVGPVVADPRPEPALTVAFALVKGDRPEQVVQKLTELGVDCIVPFVADRSVVRWDRPRAARHGERFAEIARAAAQQCRRTWLPQVTALATFADAARRPGAALAERGGRPPSLDRPAVLVGPEGGWSTGERACGLPHVELAAHVVRAETAAVAAGTLLAALRHQIVTERTQHCAGR
ncbi:MAG TPA: RsmE family RNA methyltransferase [Acidimicrobiales bacterium]|nr:RsmE family RNA methyltransferase [Acidimicrobiales bacterium]